MKISHRATTTVALSAAFLGGLLFAVPMAAQAAPPPVTGAVVPASGSPPEVVLTAAAPTALPKYRVVAGDSLWAIGVRYHRSWTALAAYNRDLIPNPNLIYVNQVITIPPATYTGSVSLPAPTPSVSRYSPPVTHHYYSAPRVTYTPPAPRPVIRQSYSGGSGSGGFTGVWACIAQHESGGNAATNTGNGYYGGLQFTLGTWQANGGSGNPANASAAEQQRVANNVVAASGGSYGAWPNTSRMCGV